MSNSTARASRNSIGKKNKVLVEQVDANPKIALVNVYKNNKGLERMSKYLDWVKDENLLVTKNLFKKHYPGSSYAILHKSGAYYAYYGEYVFKEQLRDIELFVSYIKDRN